jgi:hypothetical protein
MSMNELLNYNELLKLSSKTVYTIIKNGQDQNFTHFETQHFLEPYMSLNELSPFQTFSKVSLN